MIRRIPGVPMLRRLTVNTLGRDLIVTDVHGCFGLLEELLTLAEFDESKDRLIIAGDLTDRGPESHKALDWVLKGSAEIIRGNHCQMVIEHFENGSHYIHEENGGEWFVKMLKDDLERADEFHSWFSGLPIALEIPCKDGRTFGVVHAECPTFDWKTFTDILEGEGDALRFHTAVTAALEMRTRVYAKDDTPVTGIDLIFVGHTPVERPLVYGNTVYLDTGAVFDEGHMTLMQMDTQETWTMTRAQHREKMWKKKFRSDPSHEI
jgi:serine/threonine protein phosphatase 1